MTRSLPPTASNAFSASVDGRPRSQPTSSNEASSDGSVTLTSDSLGRHTIVATASRKLTKSISVQRSSRQLSRRTTSSRAANQNRILSPDAFARTSFTFIMNLTDTQQLLAGTVQRIVFPKMRSADGETDFRIFHLENEDGLVSVKGSAPALRTGTTVSCEGAWEQSAQFGLTFKANTIREVLPTSLNACERYLVDAKISGLGPKTAKLIVGAFRDKVFDVLDNTPERLADIKGVGRKTSERIAAGWQQRRAVHMVMMFLQAHGVHPSAAERVYFGMGGETVNVSVMLERLRQNPYSIADYSGIGFRTADELALSVGIDKESPIRIVAALSHALDIHSSKGHTMFRRDRAVATAASLIGIAPSLVDAALDEQMLQSSALERVLDGGIEYVVLSHLRSAEEKIAGNLRRLTTYGQSITRLGAPELVGPFFTCDGLQLDPTQENAVRIACTNPVVIITGRPGTGKTSATRAAIDIALGLGKRIACCAPTGLAAIRLGEAAGIEATTCHRLLGYGSPEPREPLDIDVLICDETSMMDTYLTANLLEAVPSGCVVILLGDVDQLPSVGPGNVLRDLIESQAFPVVRLSTIHRQESMIGRGLGIVDAAHAVIEGRMPPFNATDFRFVPAPTAAAAIDESETDDEKAATWVPVIVARMRDQGTPLDEIQILSPMNKGPLGVDNLNLVMQAAFNPPAGDKREITFRKATFREGDRVMQRKNDYDLGVVNGDIGYIRSIDPTAGIVCVAFSGERIVKFDRTRVLFSLAYATTIHKSQGSGFAKVIVAVTTGHAIMLNQNLVYTAITRAKTQCVLLGSRRATALAVRTKSNAARCTGLARMLEGMRRAA